MKAQSSGDHGILRHTQSTFLNLGCSSPSPLSTAAYQALIVKLGGQKKKKSKTIIPPVDQTHKNG